MWLACWALRGWTLPLARPPRARACGGGGGISYTQGQSPEPRTREYFYYVDHQGQVGRGRGRGGPLQEGRARRVGSVSKVSEPNSAELGQRAGDTGPSSPSSRRLVPSCQLPKHGGAQRALYPQFLPYSSATSPACFGNPGRSNPHNSEEGSLTSTEEVSQQTRKLKGGRKGMPLQ